MKKVIKFTCFILTSILLLCLCSCGDKGKSAVDFYYFNTVIYVQTNDKKMSEDTIDRLDKLFADTEKLFTTEGSESIVSAVNKANVGESITLSSDALSVFKKAKDCYDFTDGLFSPCVYPLVKLWKFDSSYSSVINFIPPTDEQVESILSTYSSDFNSLLLDTEKATIAKTENTMLDFGGIVKGIVCDQAKDILKQAGHQKGYVSVGSSSLNLLSVDEIEVRHPRKNTTSLLSIDTKDLKFVSVSTSGDYEREHVDKDGNVYSHVIDPRTGYPAKTGVMSATVICEDGGFADAITTALLVCSYSSDADCELLKMIDKIKKQYQTAKIFVAISHEGKNLLITNQKQGEDFTLLDQDYQVVNV
ncbi:MAG: FAD:protein FMN transferase [Clostridia bacterium]|nr:FAD:protein FMN transferase [Clostridia bacterium]